MFVESISRNSALNLSMLPRPRSNGLEMLPLSFIYLESVNKAIDRRRYLFRFLSIVTVRVNPYKLACPIGGCHITLI
jgi:hypothetical protein